VSLKQRLKRLEAAVSTIRPCNCIVAIIDVEPGETLPPIPPCPWCDAYGKIRRIQIRHTTERGVEGPYPPFCEVVSAAE
jgi:hypothetical protein